MGLREMVEGHYSGVASGDPDKGVAVFSDDVDVSIPGNPPMRGRDAHRAVAAGFIQAFPDATFTIKNVIESGDWIVVEGTYAGTHTGAMPGPAGDLPATGRSVAINYADMFHANGDKFDLHHVYFDVADFMAQLGVGPQAG